MLNIFINQINFEQFILILHAKGHNTCIDSLADVAHVDKNTEKLDDFKTDFWKEGFQES